MESARLAKFGGLAISTGGLVDDGRPTLMFLVAPAPFIECLI